MAHARSLRVEVWGGAERKGRREPSLSSTALTCHEWAIACTLLRSPADCSLQKTVLFEMDQRKNILLAVINDKRNVAEDRLSAYAIENDLGGFRIILSRPCGAWPVISNRARLLRLL